MKKRKLALIIVPIMLFILLSIFIGADIVTRFESFVYNETVEHMSPILTGIIKTITHTGDAIFVITFCLTLVIIPKTKVKFGLPVSINVLIVEAANYILKMVFSRERPDILRLVTETSPSFPSGHAMINSAMYTMLSICVYRNIKNKKIRYTLVPIFLIYPFIIGMTRVYLGVHYITDVIAGWLLGISITFIVLEILDILNKKEDK